LVPGNDDAIRSISLFTRAVSDACIEGSKLATGLKPSSDASGPKIIKKEEKQKASDPNSDEKSPVEEGVVEEAQESKESKKIQESKQGDEKAEASEEDQKSEDSKEAKEN
jgi:ribosomal protein S2